MRHQTYAYPLTWTSQFYFCALPLRLDTYRNCSFNCIYCYVRNRGGNFRAKDTAYPDINSLKRKLQNSEPTSLISQCAMRRLPLHFGGMSEPFGKQEIELKITYNTLLLLNELDYPTLISTKSDLPVVEPYFSLLKSMKHVALQFSFSTLDDDLASRLEPLAPPPSIRLRVINKLSQAGIWVSCRFQPFITGISGNIPNLVRAVTEAGTRHITVEHLKLNYYKFENTFTMLKNQCGDDLARQYDVRRLRKVGTEYECPSSVKIDNLKRFWEATRKRNITLGVGDNEFHDLGDSPNCCGVDNLLGFENCFRHQITSAIWKRDDNNIIRYSSIQHEWAPLASIRRYLNSRCRRKNNHSYYSQVDEYIKLKWNSPWEPHSPLETLNVRSTGLGDNDGNLVYYYQPIYKLD